MRVLWTAGARSDLQAMIAELHAESPAAARTFARRLRESAQRLAALPKIGRVVPEFGQDDLRERIIAPWRLVYRHHPDRVVILAVVHGRRLLDVDLAGGLDPG